MFIDLRLGGGESSETETLDGLITLVLEDEEEEGEVDRLILFGKLEIFNHYVFLKGNLLKNKCSDRSMEVQLHAISGNYDRQTDRPTNRQTGTRGHRVVSLQIINIQ